MRRRRTGWAVAWALLLASAGAAGAAQSLAPGPAGAGPPPAPARAAGEADRMAGADAHFELGEMYHRQVFEALDLAIQEYEKAIGLQPDVPQVHYNLALAYHSKAKLESDDKALYRKALQEYRLYLKYNPNGELAAKAKQNIAAVEALLGEAPRPAKAVKRPRTSKGSGGRR